MRKAIGIVRVSQTGGEEGASPAEQRARIRDFTERDGLELIETIDELDVSGGTPLEKRAGLRRAVEAVEDGSAQVIVAAYFDRLVRSLSVQEEMTNRVEAAGGDVWAVDVGAVTNGSAAKRLTSQFLGAVAEYHRNSTAERTRESQAAAIARGVAPWPGATAGYQRDTEGRHVPDPEAAPVVAEAFTMRAAGTSIKEIREYLRDNGIELTYGSTQRLLASRVVLGELHFGKLSNLHAHTAIVDRPTWERAQRVRVTRGRKAKSERLLARLGVLRCATCGARLSVGSASSGTYPLYGHPRTVDCDKRVTIGAELVEKAVTEAVREAIADEEGRASAEAHVRRAEADLERAEGDYQAAMRAFAGMEDETGARDRLLEMRQLRDEARERVEQLGGSGVAISIRGSANWDRLTLGERRDLIRAVVDRVDIAPGRGAGRISIKLVGE